MRQVVLDTETTGIGTADGHRIIEIGCVELDNRRLTGRHYHVYLQPDREIDAEAMEVHGITHEFLADKPRFPEVVDEFLAFIRGSELIIHNAPFDVGFIDYELSLIGAQYGCTNDYADVLDSLVLAREMHPGQKNSLDALCRRYQIDNSKRELHGALLDSEILADVYLAMTGGQIALSLDSGKDDGSEQGAAKLKRAFNLKVVRASEDELAAHEKKLAQIDKASGEALWRSL
jgi:DNA polymerase-3 subunit epsilon